MLNNLLYLFGREPFGSKTRQDVHIQEGPALKPVVSKRTLSADTKKSNDKYAHEIQVLVNEYGPLTQGKMLEIDLHHILQLLPRDRKKADAYKGLRSELLKQGITLTIISKKRTTWIKKRKSIVA